MKNGHFSMGWLMRELVEETNASLGRNLGVKVVRETHSRPSTVRAQALFGDRPVRALEIGCGRGKNARDIFEQLNVSELVVVDPFEKYEGFNDYEKAYIEWAYQDARRRLARYENRITWVKELSTNALRQINGRFDFIYVDGNHEYDFALADMRNYYGLLKDTAVLGGHDVAAPGVTRALIEFVSQLGITTCEIKNPDWIITLNASER